MRQRFIRSWAILAWSVLVACSPPSAPPMPEGTSEAATPMDGGWSSVDPYDPDVQEAARFAVQTFAIQNKTRILFNDVWQARQQVATGRRFELLLEVTQNGVRFRAKALVTHHPGGRYTLNEWVWQS